MYRSIISSLAYLCILSSASAVAITPRQSDYIWNVNSLTVSCDDNTGGCYYDFDVAGPPDSQHDTPEFTARCTAQVGPLTTTYRDCLISANADESPSPGSVTAYFSLDQTNFYESELSVKITYPDPE